MLGRVLQVGKSSRGGHWNAPEPPPKQAGTGLNRRERDGHLTVIWRFKIDCHDLRK